MNKIKVLHITDTPKAGSPIRITQCLNKYSDIVSARCLQTSTFKGHPTLGNIEFDIDIQYNPYDSNQLEGLQNILDKCDIVHLHTPNIDNNGLIPNRDIFNKPCILHVHNGFTQVNDYIRKNHKAIAVVAQYQPSFYPDDYILPNMIDINDPDLQPIYCNNKIPKVFYSYAYTSEQDNTLADKGARYIIPVLEKLEAEGLIKAEFHHNKSYRELIKIKQQCDICIGDIMTGSFHLTELEALSQGLMVICNINDNTDLSMKYVSSNYNPYLLYHNPFIPTLHNKEEQSIQQRLYDTIRIALDRDLQRYDKSQNRQWMFNNWNPALLVEYYEDLYNHVLNNKPLNKCMTYNQLIWSK
jgi:hypothetical protein